jgi:hypothetical protein
MNVTLQATWRAVDPTGSSCDRAAPRASPVRFCRAGVALQQVGESSSRPGSADASLVRMPVVYRSANDRTKTGTSRVEPDLS